MGRPECGITGSTLEAQTQALISHRLCALQPATLRRSTRPRAATLLRVMHGHQEQWGRLVKKWGGWRLGPPGCGYPRWA